MAALAPPSTAAALVIGNELLSGKVEEANVHVLARTLRGLGVELRRVVIILDDVDEIAREVAALSTRTTGSSRRAASGRPTTT